MDEDDIVEMRDNIVYDLDRRMENIKMTDEDKSTLLDILVDNLISIKEDLE